MKFNAKIESNILDTNYHAHLNLLVSNYRQSHELQTLDKSKDYIIEIKEVKSKRSLEQNRLLWALLGELEKQTDESLMNWYIKALIDCNAKPEYLVGSEALYESLVLLFRAVKPISKRMIVNDKGKEVEGIVYQCFVGSSKFNVKEMNQLIDVVLGYCAELGIETELLQY